MTILNQLNSVPMYLICGGIIAFVAVVCPEVWEHRGRGFVFP